MVVVIFQVSCLYYHFTWAGSNLSWIDSSHAQLNDALIAIKPTEMLPTGNSFPKNNGKIMPLIIISK